MFCFMQKVPIIFKIQRGSRHYTLQQQHVSETAHSSLEPCWIISLMLNRLRKKKKDRTAARQLLCISSSVYHWWSPFKSWLNSASIITSCILIGLTYSELYQNSNLPEQLYFLFQIEKNNNQRHSISSYKYRQFLIFHTIWGFLLSPPLYEIMTLFGFDILLNN